MEEELQANLLYKDKGFSDVNFYSQNWQQIWAKHKSAGQNPHLRHWNRLCILESIGRQQDRVFWNRQRLKEFLPKNFTVTLIASAGTVYWY